MPLDTVLLRPGQDPVRGELAAIVADDHPRPAALGDEQIQFTGNTHARERRINHQRQALPRAVIDDGEDAEAPSVGELVRYEVERPALVGTQRHQHRRPGPDRSLAPATTANGELLLPIEPEQLLVVHDETFAPQHHEKTPVTEPAALLRNRLHPLSNLAIVGTAGFVANCHAATADGFTRPPFTHPEGILQASDSFPLGRGRHHFFPTRSFSAALSSMASASSRFSRVFSSSNVFRRRASQTSIPPKRAFQL